MAERCLAEYTTVPGRFQCISDPVFHFRWVVNPSGLPNSGKHWESWSCAQHAARIIRFATAMRGLVGSVSVELHTD
ncbi:hypothetical protein [Streptomyces halobius]|uniref:Uncharacterized protein n=1 Tax=Streptomyces halobius TaxID=2879846 RepID=A0ABY4M1L8_9ACTN|nr:hypothetical protein [Streptomyces halobius]UQA91655.1 hypothetical protein K9S39_07070 [Streptomyces halobius]